MANKLANYYFAETGKQPLQNRDPILDRLESALESAYQENAALRAALAPFAKAARYVAYTWQMTEVLLYGPVGGTAKLNVEDFRRAAKALEGG